MLTDEFIGKHIDALPETPEFVSPLFVFAREIEKESRRAALEEAATVVSDHNRKGREWVADSLWDNLANECAARIRALKDKP